MKLSCEDQRYLTAAEGWLELGDEQEANEELEKITLALRSHPDVLLVRFEIYSKAGKWALATEIAGELVQIRPDEAQFWISHAYATRRMPGSGIPQAKEILGKAQTLFPKEPLIAYNLACYACQLGDQTEAWKWLETALKLGDARQVKLMALKDPDLEPLSAKIENV